MMADGTSVPSEVVHTSPVQDVIVVPVPSVEEEISLSSFLNWQPKALGVVQVMIGIVTILLGIVLVVPPETTAVFTGMVFISPAFYIVSGGLTIGASDKLNICLVGSAMRMNVVSVVFSIISITFLSLDLDIFNATVMPRTMGITGVLLLLSLLEFFISTTSTISACMVICSTPGVTPTSHSPQNLQSDNTIHVYKSAAVPTNA